LGEANVADEMVIWRRLDQPGHEAARLVRQQSQWHLSGSAVFANVGQPCRLDYRVVCGSDWRTLSARVTGWVGPVLVDVDILVNAGHWKLNGADCPAVTGCVDLDLNFSPSTNLLPIRRLNLAVGAAAPVRAAWLRFPSFTLEPLDQLYRRTAEATYRYESAGGAFVADLEVNGAGFVTSYPRYWQLEGNASAGPGS
jgi:uncharacterized protein